MSTKRPEAPVQEDSDGSDDDGPMPMPEGEEVKEAGLKRKKKRLIHEKAFLDKLPAAEMYEKSYMHRDLVTHVLVTPGTDFVVTASADGFVKFWKKMVELVEFVKQFRAHLGRINALVCSGDGLRVCTTGSDKAVKFFDVASFDLSAMLRLDYEPTAACFCHKRGSPVGRVAIACRDSGLVRVYATDARSSIVLSNPHADAGAAGGAGAAAAGSAGGKTVSVPLYEVSLHRHPVLVLAHVEKSGVVVSGDAKGVIEYWRGHCGEDEDPHKVGPAEGVNWRFKLDTDLFALAKAGAMPCGLAVGGNRFCVTATDKQVRVFDFSTGKLKRVYDESLAVVEDARAHGTLKLDPIDFGQRAARERELEGLASAAASALRAPRAPPPAAGDEDGPMPPSSEPLNTSAATSFAEGLGCANPVFDESGHFVAYTTLTGIKVINLETNSVVRVLGRSENQERFLSLALYQGTPKVGSQMLQSRMGDKPKSRAEMDDDSVKADPILVATAFKRHRFYLFSAREPPPEEASDDLAAGRDVLNEKPTAEMLSQAVQQSTVLGKDAILRTSLGDVHLKLFGNFCPKTVENFTVHSRNGYYDGTIVHRVIPSFMVQMGDPLGDGTGGESIWGGEFEDELHRNLRHDRPFTLSMANAGPNTNGSQFFITTVPCPWLDNKHTVFGRVTKGMDVVQSMEQSKCNHLDKPLEDIKILSIDISTA